MINVVETPKKTPGHGTAPCAKVVCVWSALSSAEACFLLALALLTGCQRRFAMPTRQKLSICRLSSFYNKLEKEWQEFNARQRLHFTVDDILAMS